MARSTYVYVVEYLDRHERSSVLLGAFTVKHEMVTAVQGALDNNREMRPEDLLITRLPDGQCSHSIWGDDGTDITNQFTWSKP